MGKKRIVLIVIFMTFIIYFIWSPLKRLLVTEYYKFQETKLISDVLKQSIHHEKNELKREYNTALLHINKGNLKEAVKVLTKLSETIEYDRDVYFLLTYSYHKLKDFSKEKDIYNKILDKDPAYGHFLLGASYLSQGEKELARKELQLALMIDSKEDTLKDYRSLAETFLKRTYQ